MILLKEFVDSNSSIDMIVEETGGKKDLYIKGIFAEAELKNRNGRVYPKDVMKSAIDKYNEEYVLKGRAISELSHPDGRPQPKPEFASHLVTELNMDGNTVYGKAKILNTPNGNILKGLLEGGVKFGVSTRGLGSISERAGTRYVCSDYVITAIDAVTDPSSINAFVDAVNESQEWLITDDGRIVESIKKEIKKNKLNEERKLQLIQNFLLSIRG